MSAPTTETSIQVSMYITAMAIPPSPVCSPLIDVGLRSLPSHSSSPSPANSPQIKHIPQASKSTLNGPEVLKRSSRGFDRRPSGFFRLEYRRECRQPHHVEHNLVVWCESHQQDPLIRFPCFADESNDGRDAGAIQISDLSEIEHDMRCACRQLASAAQVIVAISNAAVRQAGASAPDPPDLLAKLEGRQPPRGWGVFLMQRLE